MVKFDSITNSRNERDSHDNNTTLCHENDLILDNLVLFILDEPNNDCTKQENVNNEHVISSKSGWYHATPKIMHRRHLNGVDKNKKNLQVVLPYIRDQLFHNNCARIDQWELQT